MTNLYYQVVYVFNGMLRSAQQTGIAGQILQDKKPASGDAASWTGTNYQIALCGTPDHNWVELRKLKDGNFVLFQESKSLREVTNQMVFFIAEDG